MTTYKLFLSMHLDGLYWPKSYLNMRSLRLTRGAVHVAWNVLHDSYLSKYCVTTATPNVVACASIYIAVKIVGIVEASYSSSREVTDLLRSKWWSIFEADDESLWLTVDAILTARSSCTSLRFQRNDIAGNFSSSSTMSSGRQMGFKPVYSLELLDNQHKEEQDDDNNN